MASWKATTAAAVLTVLAIVPQARAQDWRTVTSLRQFKAESSLRVDVEYGAGRLNIRPAESSALYRAMLRYDARTFRPVTQYQEGRLKVGIEGGSIRGRNMKAGRLDLELSRQLPLDLDLKFGAVEATVELGGLRVREAHIATGASESRITVGAPNREKCSHLDIDVGAADFEASGLGNLNCERVSLSGGVGDVTLDFNGAWNIDAELDIDMGLGSLTLRLPRGLGVQVRKSGFLASFDSQGLVKRGNTYYSENWERATNRATITIDAAFGSINVQWVEPEAAFTRADR